MRFTSLLAFALLVLALASEVLGKKNNVQKKASLDDQSEEDEYESRKPEEQKVEGHTAHQLKTTPRETVPARKMLANSLDVTTSEPFPTMDDTNEQENSNQTKKSSKARNLHGKNQTTPNAQTRSLLGHSESESGKSESGSAIRKVVVTRQEIIQQEHRTSNFARRRAAANAKPFVGTGDGRIILNDKNPDYFPACVDYLPSDACRTLKPLCAVSDTARAIRYLRERSDYILYLTKDIQKHIEHVSSTLPRARGGFHDEANLSIQRELQNIMNLLPSVKKTAPLIRLILDEDSEGELERIINAHLRFKKECSVHQEMCYKTHVPAYRRKKACEMYDTICCCDGYKFQRYYQSIKKSEVHKEAKECRAMRHTARRMIEASCAATCGTCPTRFRINEYAQDMRKAFDCNHLKVPKGHDLHVHFQEHPHGESYRDELTLKRYRDSLEDQEIGEDESEETNALDDLELGPGMTQFNPSELGLPAILDGAHGRRRKCTKRHNHDFYDDGLLQSGYSEPNYIEYTGGAHNGLEYQQGGGIGQGGGFEQVGGYEQGGGIGQGGGYEQGRRYEQGGGIGQGGVYEQGGEIGQGGGYDQGRKYEQGGIIGQGGGYEQGGVYEQGGGIGQGGGYDQGGVYQQSGAFPGGSPNYQPNLPLPVLPNFGASPVEPNYPPLYDNRLN